MATLTIEDYKKLYEQARAAGDAAGMQAANSGANAIRAANGEAAQYATEDIAKVAQTAASTGYTTQNQRVYASSDGKAARQAAAAAQTAYVAANPTATQPLTEQEKSSQYADALANASGVTRTQAAGTSGADEALLSDQGYAIVQQLKSDFAAAQQQYNAAVAAGDTAAATQAQQAMDAAHLNAERVRAGAGYSGGADGSMYLPYSLLGAGTSDGESGSGGSFSGSSSGSSGSSARQTSGLRGAASRDLTGTVEDYSDYLRQLYAAKQDSAIAQLQAAYDSSMAQLDQTEAAIPAQYQAARNSAAAASEQAKRNFAQYAAASGLNSGTGGQAELARSVTLQNNLNSIDNAEADQLADVALQRANAEREYSSAIAQAKAQGEYELASALYQEKVRVQKALLDLELEQEQLELKWYQAYQK
jgi:hypothetical protein